MKEKIEYPSYGEFVLDFNGRLGKWKLLELYTIINTIVVIYKKF